jgi:YHS domain-containing protein
MRTEDDEEGGVSIDPICGRPVVEDDSDALEYKKRKYFFCSDGCRDRFERQAERIHVGELAKAGALFGERKVRWGVA